MQNLFEIAGGTVPGRDHVLAGRNNQDAFHWLFTERCLVAVVADGCGSENHSEVGAKLIARLVARAVAEHSYPLNVARGQTIASLAASLEHARSDSRNALHKLVYEMATADRDFDEIPKDLLLATVVGVFLTPAGGAAFAIGDGVYAVNGEVRQIGPFRDNAPPYLAYALTGKWDAQPKFKILEILPPDSVNSILIGTDGVAALIESADHTLPGREELVGPLSQFWTEDRYFRNPDMIRRRLTLANREVTRIDWERQSVVREVSLLPDDTTLVVVRRRKS